METDPVIAEIGYAGRRISFTEEELVGLLHYAQQAACVIDRVLGQGAYEGHRPRADPSAKFELERLRRHLIGVLAWVGASPYLTNDQNGKLGPRQGVKPMSVKYDALVSASLGNPQVWQARVSPEELADFLSTAPFVHPK